MEFFVIDLRPTSEKMKTEIASDTASKFEFWAFDRTDRDGKKSRTRWRGRGRSGARPEGPSSTQSTHTNLEVEVESGLRKT